MSILVGKETRLIVQGITGREGAFHAGQMKAYGTNVVAGVTPGKGGQEVDGTPVFDSVAQAREATAANASIIFVPAAFAADAALEAIAAGIELVVVITEHIPVADMTAVTQFAKSRGATLIGPNCPGLITPGEALLGIMPGIIFKPGRVGLVSRSGTLTYEVVDELSRRGIGQSTCVGIGGDPVIGTRFIDTLRAFEADPETELVIMIGEIGGSDEETAAEYIKGMKTPVVSFIGGRTAPEGKRMGHAGAIISGNAGTAQSKIAALTAARVPVADTLTELVDLAQARLG
ncbi:MAG TPA: succinate--CoA ligase subunit alpha [Limnochordia bacterium]|nr:succinate--CoA ligase subunit alpha [Limnochordia bacterium]